MEDEYYKILDFAVTGDPQFLNFLTEVSFDFGKS